MRIDKYLVSQGFAKSRDRAADLIRAGGVLMNGVAVKKSSLEVSGDVEVIGSDQPYVSRGGLKLEAALREFGVDVSGMICMDIGVATGGFTDCLLQHGAQRVYAVDIGEGQLDSVLASDLRVVFLPKTDARELSEIPSGVELIVIDVSFISITHLLPMLKRLLKPEMRVIALIKPQYEVGHRHAGVLNDENQVLEILADVEKAFQAEGFEIMSAMPAPVKGKEGNQEFLWLVAAVFGA